METPYDRILKRTSNLFVLPMASSRTKTAPVCILEMGRSFLHEQSNHCLFFSPFLGTFSRYTLETATLWFSGTGLSEDFACLRRTKWRSGSWSWSTCRWFGTTSRSSSGSSSGGYRTRCRSTCWIRWSTCRTTSRTSSRWWRWWGELTPCCNRNRFCWTTLYRTCCIRWTTTTNQFIITKVVTTIVTTIGEFFNLRHQLWTIFSVLL